MLKEFLKFVVVGTAAVSDEANRRAAEAPTLIAKLKVHLIFIGASVLGIVVGLALSAIAASVLCLFVISLQWFNRYLFYDPDCLGRFCVAPPEPWQWLAPVGLLAIPLALIAISAICGPGNPPDDAVQDPKINGFKKRQRGSLL